MIDYFPKGLSFILRPENDGQGFHETPKDLGLSTSWGVTFSTYAGWKRLHQETPSMADFKSLGWRDFEPLYRAAFWNACRCGNMGALGLQIFDAAVNCGPREAAVFLQTVVGTVEVDGQIGPLTVAAVNNTDPLALNAKLFIKRESYYATRPTARYFERGWDRRAADCRDFVLQLIAQNQTSKSTQLVDIKHDGT